MRYIDRAELFNRLAGVKDIGEAFAVIQAMPAADVVERDCFDRLLTENDELREVRPVVRGRWVQVMGKYDWMVKCSRCYGVPLETSNFCPNCGADMREES